jgi:acetyl-CoA carboxylase biotin carboxylase subunit
MGEKISGKDYFPQGHAIECRINAEDPYNDFRPSPGKISVLHQPVVMVFVLTALLTGYVIPPFYDSMFGKLITIARTRNEAIVTMYVH